MNRLIHLYCEYILAITPEIAMIKSDPSDCMFRNYLRAINAQYSSNRFFLSCLKKLFSPESFIHNMQGIIILYAV